MISSPFAIKHWTRQKKACWERNTLAYPVQGVSDEEKKFKNRSRLSPKHRTQGKFLLKLSKGNPKLRGSISTVHLLVLACSNQLLFILTLLLLSFSIRSYLKKEFNCTEPSPFVRAPWPILSNFLRVNTHAPYCELGYFYTFSIALKWPSLH